MEWLFGHGDVDLSSAERAIDQLSQDRDASQDRVTKLEEQAQQQKRRIEDLQRALRDCNLAEEKAHENLEHARRKSQQRATDIANTLKQLSRAYTIFSLQEEAERAARQLKSTRELLFPRPLVLAGPTAAGKATIISRLLAELDSAMALPTCHTSRQPEPGEKDGVHFWFAGKEEMQAAAKRGRFLEIAELDDDLYGTSIDAVRVLQNAGRVAVMSLDLAGVQQLKASGFPSVIVWVQPPSAEDLRKRLPQAKGMTPEQVQRTVMLAQQDMQQAAQLGGDLFDHIIQNDELDAAYSQVRAIALRLLGRDGKGDPTLVGAHHAPTPPAAHAHTHTPAAHEPPQADDFKTPPRRQSPANDADTPGTQASVLGERGAQAGS